MPKFGKIVLECVRDHIPLEHIPLEQGLRL